MDRWLSHARLMPGDTAPLVPIYGWNHPAIAVSQVKPEVTCHAEPEYRPIRAGRRKPIVKSITPDQVVGLIEKGIIKDFSELPQDKYVLDFGDAGSANTQAAKAAEEVAEKPELIAALDLLWKHGTKRPATKSGRPKRTLGRKDGIGGYAVSISVDPPSKK